MQAKDIKVGEDYAVWRYGRSRYNTPVRARVVGEVMIQANWSRSKPTRGFNVVFGDDIARPITKKSIDFARPWADQEVLDAAAHRAAQAHADQRMVEWVEFDRVAEHIDAQLGTHLVDNTSYPTKGGQYRTVNAPPTSVSVSLQQLETWANWLKAEARA